jgi:phospholipid/cholesterol/gamma-HCH transport system permease protein
MIRFITAVGHSTLQLLASLGRASLLLLAMLRGLPSVLKRPRLLIDQMHSVGVLTISIVSISGLFVGMVLALQSHHILSRFGADSALGLMVAAALIRELGPVLSALLFTGRAGSALTAEIGLMKATEQLSSLEMMAVNPKYHILAPRFLASFLSVPLLAALFSSLGVLGGWLVGGVILGVDEAAFWGGMQGGIDLRNDLINGVIKSITFGFVCAWIAIYQGYDCVPTSEGVSRATTRTVVQTSMAVLGLDFILTALMFNH